MRLTTIVLLAALALAACGATAPSGGSASANSITISGAWARPSTAAMGEGGMAEGGMGNGAAYMVISNSAAQPDRLMAAAGDVAGAIELHTVENKDGVMAMRPVDGIDVPAGGQVELKPGSFHVMLIGLKQELTPGDRIPLTLRFQNAGEVQVEAEVRSQ